jgi:hypothetical protein
MATLVQVLHRRMGKGHSRWRRGPLDAKVCTSRNFSCLLGHQVQAFEGLIRPSGMARWLQNFNVGRRMLLLQCGLSLDSESSSVCEVMP